ncbi:MAG: glutathionylspermidine synthase family protein [Chloroflexi bacterium]|nr:glutathionylspermidine synthase family protein [Chloroflexota bacterium]
MRVLLTDTDVPPALYRRLIRRAVCRGLVPDHLTHGTPYLSLNAVVLTDAELAKLVEISECFARIFAWAGRCIAEDVDALVTLGFPWTVAEILRGEPSRPVVLGRFDFVVDGAGHWWLLEYNSDTPSGLRESTAVDEAAFQLLQARFAGRRANGALVPRLVAAVRVALAGGASSGPGSPPTAPSQPLVLGLLTDAGELEDLAQMAFTEQLLRIGLAGDPVEIVLGDVDNLTRTRHGGIALLGRPLDALYRYYPFETLLGRPAFSAIADAAAAGRLRLLNGLRGFLLQNKGLLAWIWARRNDPALTPMERAAIQHHLPPTWWIRDVPPDVDRRATVVKQVFGREGEEVYFGDAMTERDWDRCRQWGSYVVQQRIEVPPLASIAWSWQGRPEPATRWATVGSFVAAEAWAGCYTRLGNRIVTSRAEFVPTFVEEAVGGRQAAVSGQPTDT